jgi:protein arginine kinase activator
MRAGCPECYASFRSEIAAVMKNNGFEISYTGTLPRKLGYFKSPLTDRLMLQSRLEEAVRAEDYEKAAVYRDRLRILERDGITAVDEGHDKANPDILKEGADE